MIHEMNAKVKGVFKGLRYISSIFEAEPKEAEIQIGLPTDVKHVSHIGFDGPTSDSNPSWMKEYKSSEEAPQSAPLSVGHTKENPDEGLRASQDSQQKLSGANNSREHEIRKTNRRHSSNKDKDLSENRSSGKEKHRHSGRRSAKDLSEKSNSNRELQLQDNENYSSEFSSSGHLQEPSKHIRRKKSKELDHSGSGRSRSSRSKGKRSTANEVGDDNAESSVGSRSKAYTQVS